MPLQGHSEDAEARINRLSSFFAKLAWRYVLQRQPVARVTSAYTCDIILLSSEFRVMHRQRNVIQVSP